MLSARERNEAGITIWAGSGRMLTGYGENWRQDRCREDRSVNGEPGCPIPVMEILASHGFKTGDVPKDIARYCADPCTQILHESQIAWLQDRSAHRVARLKAIRELRAERSAIGRVSLR